MAERTVPAVASLRFLVADGQITLAADSYLLDLWSDKLMLSEMA